MIAVNVHHRACILVQVTIYRRLRISPDLNNPKPTIYRNLYQNTGPEPVQMFTVQRLQLNNVQLLNSI